MFTQHQVTTATTQAVLIFPPDTKISIPNSQSQCQSITQFHGSGPRARIADNKEPNRRTLPKHRKPEWLSKYRNTMHVQSHNKL